MGKKVSEGTKKVNFDHERTALKQYSDLVHSRVGWKGLSYHLLRSFALLLLTYPMTYTSTPQGLSACPLLAYKFAGSSIPLALPLLPLLALSYLHSHSPL